MGKMSQMSHDPFYFFSRNQSIFYGDHNGGIGDTIDLCWIKPESELFQVIKDNKLLFAFYGNILYKSICNRSVSRLK